MTGEQYPNSGTSSNPVTTYNGPFLQSATNPENGTVSYTYNGYNKIATKHDAKGQDIVYTYDNYARLTKVQRYPQGVAQPEDTCQQENYYYDTNTFDPGYPHYSSGRLTAVQYYGPAPGSNYVANPGLYTGSANCLTTFTEMYDYSPSPEERSGSGCE
jgi:YD repeat-containing protein